MESALLRAYEELGSSAAASRVTGFPRDRARRFLEARGVLRTPEDYRSANGRMNRVLPFKSEFWATWTPASAWAWGLISGDGWIERRAVHLCGTREVCERVRDLSGGGSLYERKGCVSVYLGGITLVELAEEMLGLSYGNKAERIRIPQAGGHRTHFLRGLWDSDGSWNRWADKRRTRSYLVGALTSKSVRMLDDAQALAMEYGAKGTRSMLKTGIGQLRFFGQNVDALGLAIYADSLGIRCERKFGIFSEGR